MKVKLIFPPAFSSELYCLSSEMATISSLLKECGHHAEQVNLSVKWYLFKYLQKNTNINLALFNDIPSVQNYLHDGTAPEIEEAVDELMALVGFGPADVFKFVLRDYKQMAVTLCLAKNIKEFTGKPIVLGGAFPQTVVDELLDGYAFVDHVVTGEGEAAFLVLLEQMGRRERPARIVHTETPVDLNTLPAPDFDPLTIRVYKSIKIFYLPYEIIRGCPSRCFFCVSGNGDKLRFKSPEKVCRDIAFLKNKHHCRVFHFSSSSINFSLKFITGLLQEMESGGLDIHWSAFAIPNDIMADAALIRRMKAAGCIKLKFGIETGSANMLTALNKSCSVETTRKVLETASREGVFTYTTFLHSYLYEPRKEHLKTLEYIKLNDRHISMANSCRFVLHWGSPVYRNPQKFGIRIRQRSNKIFCDSEVNPFDEINGLNWEEKQIQQEQRNDEILALANRLNIITEKRLPRSSRVPLEPKLRLELQGLI